MHIDTLVRYLDQPRDADVWLRSLRLENLDRAHRNLLGIVKTGLTLDLMAAVCEQLEVHLPKVSDPDMALNNLDRFIASQRSPLATGSLFERDLETLPTLLQIFSTSQHLSDLLVLDSESFDLLRMTEGQPVARDSLVDDLCAEVAGVDERQVLTSLRRFKRRETLRIAYGDIVKRQRIDTVTKQISFLADAICEAAVRWTRHELEQKRGRPLLEDGQPARFVVLGLGKLGGEELNYSSDIDLIFLCDGDGTGKTDGPKPVTHREFFDRLARGVVKLLSEATELGAPYRVDLRLRPDGNQGPAVIGLDAALRYYDVAGRTWERQAFVKARPVAGDLDLGRELLSQLQPWIYRRYLSRADIAGIKALKRRIEQRTKREGDDTRNVKTGHGGIRDIEFVIQFLQLLNGGDLPEIRTGNTLQAIVALERAGCLTMQERTILEENYEFLRKLEHRLQILFDLQTHTLPESEPEQRHVAIRMGYDAADGSALASFKSDLRQKTDLNRSILDHLLHDAFGEESETEPASDLILDPDPQPAMIDEVLGACRFRSPREAFHNLMACATEPIRFLSTRRCRHFFASIAPRLLEAIAKTPDPDSTLVNLSQVSDSLGGKGVLWELFSFNPPTLKLYVQVCASSPYLSGILTSNPGMIDELLDSLLLDRLPTLAWLGESLAELCRGAEDFEPILHSFKGSNHLRIGVRDILGKDNIRDIHRSLSDVAEACLQRIAEQEYERLVPKHGEPTIGDGPRAGQRCELVILALGKLGGREPNYHSDLDVVFLYEADGMTKPRQRGRRETPTSNQHFFSQLCQRIIKVVTHLGPFGKLYELDPRLRPTGKSGALAISLPEFTRYFAEGQGMLWERQALCKARPVTGSPAARDLAMQHVRQAILQRPWRPADAEEIRQMRLRLQESATPRNLKRGFGGTVDVEFLVQILQLKHAETLPQVLTPGTFDALAELQQAGCLNRDEAAYWTASYRCLRRIETGLRLMNLTARHDLPDDETELRRLAYLLGYANHHAMTEECHTFTAENRRRFEQHFEAASRASR